MLVKKLFEYFTHKNIVTLQEDEQYFMNRFTRAFRRYIQYLIKMTESKPRVYPSASRNEGPILEVLKQFLGRSDKIKVFEVAAGTSIFVTTLGLGIWYQHASIIFFKINGII